LKQLEITTRFFENYFIQSEPVQKAAEPLIDPNLETATLDNVPIVDSSNLDHQSTDAFLACLLEKHLSAPKEPTENDKKNSKARAKGEELNSALNTATAEYQRREKKNKIFKFP
jgi:hypothetical protein